MSLQIAEEIATSVGADLPVPQAAAAVMEADDRQFIIAWKWIGAARLAHEAAVEVFAGSQRGDTSAAVVGNALSYLSASGLISALPNSAVGHLIEALTGWVEADAFVIPDFGGAITLSGSDVEITPEGNVWIKGLGDTGVGIGHEDRVASVSIAVVSTHDGETDAYHLGLTVRFAQSGPVRLRAVR